MPRTLITYVCEACGNPFERRFSGCRVARYCTNRCFHDVRSAQRREHARLLVRFMAKVAVDEASGCWLWTGYVDVGGYARFHLPGRPAALAHRVGYTLLVGPIPDDRVLDHLCRARACVNPEHLEAITALENVLRGDSFAARAHRTDRCVNGHLYPAGQIVGRRHCSACARASRARCRRKRTLRQQAARREAA